MIPESPLTTRTRELYRRRPRTMTAEVISAATGLSVPFIYTWAAGKTDCSVNRVTVLYEYLAGKKLDVA